MPTYEYKCEACGHAFERFQPMTSAPVKVCPVCGKKKVKRLIGAGAGLIFKGSGFYITDYRSEGYKNSAKGDAAPTTPAASDSSAKPAESKPAAAADSSKAAPTPAPAAPAKPAAPETKSKGKSAKS